MAPNMVTLVGFFFILANVALMIIYMPDLVGPVRLCLLNLGGLFLSHENGQVVVLTRSLL